MHYICNFGITWECGSSEGKRHIGEKRNLTRAYKRLDYFQYCQLVLWWNINFLHTFRVGWPMCESLTAIPHPIHVAHVFGLKNLPHVMGRVKSESKGVIYQ